MDALKKYYKANNDKEFQEIISEVINNKEVQKMHEFRQHFDTSCYMHCYEASYYCYKICKKWGLDYKSAARGAMLHDMFLYDWRVKGDRKGYHAFTHGKSSCANALKVYDLNDIEKDMITNHMWPVTIKIPKSKEGLILTFVDKYCALKEGVYYLKVKLNLF